MSEQNPFGPPSPASPPSPPFDAFGQPPAQGHPGYPGQGAPGWPVYPAPARKSRKGLWITLGCVGGAVLIAGGVLVSSLADAASKMGTHTIVLPQSFQQMPRNDSDPVAKKLQSSLAQTKDRTTPLSTVYTNDESGRKVGIFGMVGDILSPTVENTGFWSGFDTATSKNSSASGGERKTFDAGPLGGMLSCEIVTVGQGNASVCAWVDNSALVALLETTNGEAPSLDKAAADALELRATAEVKK